MVTATKPIPFVDLKVQYAALRAELDPVIQETIEQTAFVMGKRVQDLEEAVAAYSGPARARPPSISPWPARG